MCTMESQCYLDEYINQHIHISFGYDPVKGQAFSTEPTRSFFPFHGFYLSCSMDPKVVCLSSNVSGTETDGIEVITNDSSVFSAH